MEAVDATLLLVEDDASVREVTQLGLQRAGFTVLTARDGREGLSLFRSRRPDAVILDVMLPGLDGLEVCRAIRGESAVPVVMLTALSGTIDVVVGLEAGADDYVTKPFEMPELVARVRAALRRATQASPSEVVALGPLRIDPAAHAVEGPGGEIAPPPPSSACWSSWPAAPGRSSPARCCWSGSGATATWATPAWWMWRSSGCGPRWRPTRRSPP